MQSICIFHNGALVSTPMIPALKNNPAVRYLLPFFAFMALTEMQRFGTPQTIFWIYGAKTALTLFLLWLCFKDHRAEIQGGFDIRAVLLGLAVLVLWIGIGEQFRPPSVDAAFNPAVFESLSLRLLAAAIRITGACLAVPLMEELLWRSFLMRYLIQKDFLMVRLGQYTHFSFWITVAAFTLVHQQWEWPAAVLTGILYGGYLVRTGNLRGVIWAHAVTNAGLAVYVLYTRQWFWW